MSQFYDRLQGTASRLLTKYKQGTVEIGRPSNTPGANPWDAPTLTTVWTELNAIARGVSQSLVDGVQVVASDLQVIASLTDYTPIASDLMRIDGKRVTIVRIDQIPAAGDPVATRLIVRS
jgi:hypothetical protein